MAYIITKNTFTDTGLMNLVDISGRFHHILKTTKGNYINILTSQVLVKIETTHFMILIN